MSDYQKTIMMPAGWDVNLYVDGDNHLNIAITNDDESNVIEVDITKGNGTHGEPFDLRFTTELIEEEYIQSL